MSKTGARPAEAGKPRLRPSGKERRRLPLWRKLLILLSLLGFLAFFCPVVGGILNVANLAAMTGFLLLAAVFLRWPGFLRLLRWFWGRRWGKVLLLVLGVGTGALAVTLLVLFCLVATKLHAVPPEPCPTMIVLGCQVRGTVPSLLLS